MKTNCVRFNIMNTSDNSFRHSYESGNSSKNRRLTLLSLPLKGLGLRVVTHNCKILFISSLIFFTMLFVACGSGDKQTDTSPRVINNNVQENIEKVNKFLNAKDNDRIEAFLRRHDLQATFDETGFWIAQIEKGNGEKITNGILVALKCEIFLLDGTLCYQYDENNPLVFVTGKSNELSTDLATQNVVSGLHNALLLMKKNERAVLVFPPYLAHGIIGDGANIPPRSILVYDVKILDIENKKNEN